MAVQGHCDPRFASLKSELESQLNSGNELGASIVVNIDGENVVDIWGGHADSAHTQPWDRDTIANVWSSTKTITTLAALIQISRGHLDPDAPVSKYWVSICSALRKLDALSPISLVTSYASFSACSVS